RALAVRGAHTATAMIPARAVPRWVLPSLFASFHFSSLLALSSLFFSFPCSWLAVHVSLAFPLVSGILFIPAVANLLLASFTDPGILHRGNRSMARAPEGRFDLHWCQKCQCYCPPRTFHCPCCNICVEEFDHHCKWLNNCIGCRNFRFFFLFVAFLCSYNMVVLASCITYLALNSHQAYGTEKICSTGPAFLSSQPLCLSCPQPPEEGRANPFDLGWARNWYAALCAPQGPK
uniref:Palmitoyltransferase n=1 Tax=Chelonoidis abingdonii TaxID=106734 RepID=A0A8C0GFP9_CHEAB